VSEDSVRLENIEVRNFDSRAAEMSLLKQNEVVPIGTKIAIELSTTRGRESS